MNGESSRAQASWERESSIGQAPPSSSQGVVRRLNLRHWILVSLSGLLLLSGIAYGGSRLVTVNSDPSRRATVRLLRVKTAKVRAVNSYSTTQTYTGEVAAARASELGFERSGTLIQLNVEPGDRVTTGEAIAKLDTQNLEAQLQQLLAQKAQAVAVLQELQNGPRTEAIAAARAEVRNLANQSELEQLRRSRREYLYAQGAIAKEQLDEVAFNQDALRERQAAAQSRLAELEAGTRREQIAAQQAVVRQLEASIADLKITIAKSTITAPFSGAIGERRLDEGTVVEAGQPVVRLVEGATPEVEIGIPAAAASQLEPGSQHRVQIGQETYSATVAALKPEVNPATRTRTVILTLDTSAFRSVAPQQVARLDVRQTVPTDGYWLPIAALVRQERGLWSCYALVAAHNSNAANETKAYRVERRDVEVLHTQSDRVLVRGTIQPGDTVIVDGIQRIVPGQLVEPIGS